MRVGDCLRGGIAAAEPYASIDSVEEALLRDGVLAVLRDGEFLGLVTSADVVERSHRLVLDCVAPRPALAHDASVEDALALMDGERHEVLPVFRDGAFRGVVGYRDLAEGLVREQEQALRHYLALFDAEDSAELEAGDALAEGLHDRLARSEQLDAMRLLAGGIAHDLNNLLTVLLGNIDFARTETPPTAPIARHLDGAARSAAQIRRLSRQLLRFSRRGSPSPASADTSQQLRESAEFFAHGGSARVEADIAPGLDAPVLDRDRLAQVVNNLLLNAVQAVGPQGGTVRLTARPVHLPGDDTSGLPSGDFLSLTVADDGPGVAAGDRERIFDLAFTTKPDGSGIGLALVRSLVTAAGGTVELESAPGLGATFRVLLPVARD